MDIQTVDRLTEAIEFATIANQNQYRKSGELPYISHPFTVGTLLIGVGASIEVIIGGYLHDTIEDTSVTAEELEKIFGEQITEIVLGCSEPDKSLSWEDRKEYTIDYLRREASVDVCMVMCADKLHNIRTTVNELSSYGEVVWERFNRGRDQQAWYYQQIVAILGEKVPEFPLYLLLKAEVERVFEVN